MVGAAKLSCALTVRENRISPSTRIGTASEAIGRLGLSPAAAQAFQANVATAYALSYIFGLITIVLFEPSCALAASY